MTYIYDGILESHQAREIAEDMNVTEEDAALTWFSEVISEGCGTFESMPMFHQFVGSIDDEWDLYFDYGANYYFAVNDCYEED